MTGARAAVKLAPSMLAADLARLGDDLHRTVQRIRALGKRVGVAINPATPAAVLEEIVPDLDQVLVMTVNPGFGHQTFIRTTLPKIGQVRGLIERRQPGCEVEVDGGIDATTAPLVVRAGASALVAGSAIFGDGQGVAAAMTRLRAAVRDSECEPEPAEQAARQRSQSCNSG
jgi:ribulose-phosphate 3-epimerase